MSKVVLYIAQSLDGFIAKPDGNIDWLTSVPNPETGDYGYEVLLQSIGTIVMGRKTYDEVMGFGIEWPYSGYQTYVVTNDATFKIKTPDTYVLSNDINKFIIDIKKKESKDIWLVGGGQLITYFINNDLLDKMIIIIVPKIIGEGIPLFSPKPTEGNWTLQTVEQFNTGLVNLTYEKPL